jgi:peroxiredoxin
VLLLLFVAGISYNLAQGRTPDCHCFGQFYSAPAGWPTLIRNLVLSALAGFVAWFGRGNAGPSALTWIGVLTVTQRLELLGFLIVLALLTGMGWLLFHILRQQGRLLLRIEAIESRLGEAGFAPMAVQGASAERHGLAVGTQAPGFRLPDLYGERITLEALRSTGLAVVLFFTDPNCGPCAAILSEVSRWQRDYANKLSIAVVSRGPLQTNRSKAGEYGITCVLLQQDREVAAAYQASATPSAVLIDRDGTIGSPLAQGADAIRGLVARAVGLPVPRTVPMEAFASQRNGRGASVVPRPPTGLKIGDPAPGFSLSDLSGKLVRLSDFQGSQTLVLFWRPSCGFCQRMLADLKAWETQPPAGATRLLVVSTDSAQDNQAMGLRSPVVLDQAGMSIGSRFGVSGTPMAILVDAEGRIASELAAGAPAVLALASGGQGKTTPTR